MIKEKEVTHVPEAKRVLLGLIPRHHSLLLRAVQVTLPTHQQLVTLGAQAILIEGVHQRCLYHFHLGKGLQRRSFLGDVLKLQQDEGAL